MENERNYIIDGFVFHTRKEAEKAQKEYDGIEYLRKNADLSDPDKMLQLYNRMLEQGLFETAVGLHFLRNLQTSLREIPYISDEVISPIDAGRQVPEAPKEQVAVPEKKPVKSRRQQKKDAQSELKQTVADTRVRAKFAISLVINIILILLVGGMFFIASTTDSTTILNYKNKVINEYEDWEKELEEREQAIEEYEEKYEIDSSGTQE